MRRALPLFFALASLAAHAQIEELENPGTATAVQDRLYRLNHELTLGVGMLPLDAFYKGFIGQVAYTYHFNDSFAWQVGRATYSYNLNTSLRQQLERDFGVQPTAFDEVNWFVGSDLVWSPLYGKLAVLNHWVQHFEVSLVGGLSVLRLTLASGSGSSGSPLDAFGDFRPAVNLGFSVRLFFSKNISWRLDVTDHVVVAERIFNVAEVQVAAALNFGATE